MAPFGEAELRHPSGNHTLDPPPKKNRCTVYQFPLPHDLQAFFYALSTQSFYHPKKPFQTELSRSLGATWSGTATAFLEACKPGVRTMLRSQQREIGRFPRT